MNAFYFQIYIYSIYISIRFLHQDVESAHEEVCSCVWIHFLRLCSDYHAQGGERKRCLLSHHSERKSTCKLPLKLRVEAVLAPC